MGKSTDELCVEKIQSQEQMMKVPALVMSAECQETDMLISHGECQNRKQTSPMHSIQMVDKSQMKEANQIQLSEWNHTQQPVLCCCRQMQVSGCQLCFQSHVHWLSKG